MDELFFEGYGIIIFKRSGKYFVRYDTGELVIKMREDEVTEKEVHKMIKSEQDAYEVLIAIEERETETNKS